jgi:hypothetical protein
MIRANDHDFRLISEKELTFQEKEIERLFARAKKKPT